MHGVPEVEFIGANGWYRRSGHFGDRPERSVMTELLGAERASQLEVTPGVFVLPGSPP
jgi:hypothetical protein